jgi:hypothetical protein
VVGDARHPEGDFLGAGGGATASGQDGHLAAAQAATAEGEAFPAGGGDLQGDVGAGPLAERHQHAAPLPRPGDQTVGDRGGDLARDGHDHHVYPVDQGRDDGGPVGAGVGHESEPFEVDPALLGGQRAQRRKPDHRAPRARPGSLGQQRQQQGGRPAGRRGPPGGYRHRATPAQATAGQQAAQFGYDRQHPMHTRRIVLTGRPNQLGQGGRTADHASRHRSPLV